MCSLLGLHVLVRHINGPCALPVQPCTCNWGPLPPLCTLYSGAKTLSTSLISPVFSSCWRFDYLRPVNTRISHLFPSHVAIKFILTFKILVEYLRLSCLCNPPRKLKTRTLYRSFALIQEYAVLC